MLPLYENKKCPVCEKVFEDGDDIVTCPDCGTPHHRECYKSIGHCANIERHGDDFSYREYAEAFEAAEREEKAKSDKEFEKNTDDALSREKQETEAVLRKAKSTENEIDGVAINDVACFIGNNSEKFIIKYKKNRKVSWNWCAFFFGPLYLAYRKMFIQSIAAIALYISSFYLASSFFIEKLNTWASLYEAAIATKNAETIAAFAASPENQALLPLTYIIIGATVLINIIIAVSANSIYRKRIVSTIKLIDENIKQIKSGENDKILPLDIDIISAEGRKNFIEGRGGVSPAAPLIVLSILMFFLLI